MTQRTDFTDWLGRIERHRFTVDTAPVAALAATLDRERIALSAGEELPPLWHWLYLLPLARQSDLGQDGHPRLGAFLPPLPLKRRMWASGELLFEAPLRVGEEVERKSTIESIKHKQGRSGEMIFLTLHHELHGNGGRCISERQHLVYRGPPRPRSGQADAGEPVPEAEWSMEIKPDPMLLFRYSALTFNAHRIHYDRDYAINEEYYPALVVQGPLIATLLMELLLRQDPAARVRRFAFRALRPLYDTGSFAVCGRRSEQGLLADLWARGADGAVAMRAEAQLQRDEGESG